MSSIRGLLVACLCALPFVATKGVAAEVVVMSSGGFYSAMEELGPAFEKATGHKIVLISGSSMGSSPTAIPARIQRGEAADLLMMAGTELDKLIEQGFAIPGSRVDLVHSKIGMVVRAGQPKPDIGTKEAFEKVLLDAKSIGYSASASGVYLSQEVFPKIGAEGRIMSKAKEIVKDRVATWVARGDLELGFQQVSELLPIPGVDFVGAIPEPYQKVTVFSVGAAKTSKEPTAAQELVRFLISPVAYPIIEKQGLEPAALATKK
ncbi:substrate-binding domain-containing protein [Propionivibrio soli]|uniref:substrate-binding domain-containing protein n=1 Tax=Propionivibrio soli TaxID=2976531 RepID=UPI0021E85048|nr:substrate-binding domain-containing protein [Propionivibrio soli]